jgi:hypothetical protein
MVYTVNHYITFREHLLDIPVPGLIVGTEIALIVRSYVAERTG